MTQVQTECVLVVPTEAFHDLGYFQGFCDDPAPYLDGLLLPELMSFRPRAEVEEDPSFKQLIPYCLLKHGERLFQYTRGKGQGEGRLHAKRSVGIGGHISEEDAAGAADPYQGGMQRELDEEVILDCNFEQSIRGLINDDQTEVGRVHLGVVHLFELDEPGVRAREEDLLEAGFAPIQQMLADLDGFETWSQICLQALFSR